MTDFLFFFFFFFFFFSIIVEMVRALKGGLGIGKGGGGAKNVVDIEVGVARFIGEW